MYSNFVEEYYEYMFEYKNKLRKIQKEFESIGFRTTYLDDKRIAILRENTYIEFYQDASDDKYIFSINHKNKNNRLFTNNFDKIEIKIKEVKKIIGE